MTDLQTFEIYDANDNLLSILAPNNLNDCTTSKCTPLKFIEVGNFNLLLVTIIANVFDYLKSNKLTSHQSSRTSMRFLNSFSRLLG